MTRFALILRSHLPCAVALLVTNTLILPGCGDTSNTGSTGTVATPPPADDDHAHAHPSKGPHQGDLVELGNEEYHAEIVHGDGGEVTIYVLDSAAIKAVPIDATKLVINTAHEGDAEQFELPAAPDAGDPDGKSSRYRLRDEHLAEDLDAEGTIAKLVLTINSKQYTGKIDHDHEEHDHDH